MSISETIRNHKSATGAVLLIVLVVAVPVIGAVSLGLTGSGGDATAESQLRSESFDAGGGSAQAGASRHESGEVSKATPAPDGVADSGSTGQYQQLSTGSRAIVREGTVGLRVDDYESTRAALTAKASELGGYVADADQRRHRERNVTWVTGEVVIRVPADNFDQLLAFAKRQGGVTMETTSSRDVTDRLVDLNARIKNLEAQRDRLRTLYARANTTEDLLAIQNRLTDVQGKIERLQADRRELKDRVAHSTLTVRIQEPDPKAGPLGDTQYHKTGLFVAFFDSVGKVVILFRAGVVTLAYALPYLLALGGIAIVGGATRRTYRRLKRRDSMSSAEPPDE